MRRYKLVAGDLDGTLLNNQSMVSQENLQAIEALAKKGIPFVPISGRTFGDMPQPLKENPFIRYFIYSNGAAVWDRQTDERILFCIPRKIVGQILEILTAYKVHLTVRCNGKTYVDATGQTDEAFAFYHVCGPHQKVIKNHGEYQEGFGDFLSFLDQVEGISIFFHDEAEQAECTARLAALHQLSMVESWPYCLEIFNPDAGKEKALISLANWLNIRMEETIAVGDGGNDLAMLQAAGLGLAVSNATEKVKARADEVICSNEEHAIRHIYFHYFERR